MTLRILVGCEFSGIVRDAFIDRGHDAISCDFRPSESDKGPHYQGNVLDLLNCKWDLIIMHPDCTCVCNAGNKTYAAGFLGWGTDNLGYIDRLTSAMYVQMLWLKARIASKNVCFENPSGVLRSLTGLPKAQWIQPYEYGHMEQKRTGLYKTDNLPNLESTNNVYHEMMKLPAKGRQRVFYMSPHPDRPKDRSRFYPGIAAAMAEQWGSL